MTLSCFTFLFFKRKERKTNEHIDRTISSSHKHHVMAGVFVLLLLIVVIYVLSYLIYKTYFYFPPIEIEQLSDRRVIITGASRGIGEELAYEYSRYNCRLILAARSIDVLRERIAKKCRELGAKDVQCVEFDASKRDSCIQLIEKTLEFYQGIDVLVLNHTASVYQPFFQSEIQENVEHMERLIQTNFFGYFYPSRTIFLFLSRQNSSRFLAMTALPHLAKSGTSNRRSQIIAVSSLAGSCPLPKTTIYGTTKHAIQGFFSNLSRECRTCKSYENVTSTIAILGLIGTDTALQVTNKNLHIIAADVRKTAQAILAAGIYGQSLVYYPYAFAIIPPLYYLFRPLFELAARVRS